ncbi:heme A synthase [Primorskyibacter flagellatus]|uniref:Heme A synthase n=1 Tax=Primorskyibacter flagellatus TaxID=1387277 RepID=A0A1W1Z9D8_9RHOB|nr:heme A synthase [Primorskyibacter flagellatus]SMC45024.1 cytochrome c oxidase assembly protein subunit 15 [Primorskyibacter flagellatus]
MSQKRSIFEEVETRDKAVPQTGVIDRAKRGARGPVRLWLVLIFALVVAMILVGGLTRLTDSGLSITEWKPVTGALPPITQADWQAEFELYQKIPQYELQNMDMTLSEFKAIYWWEWGHRQLGRVIGLVWALGFIGFLLARKIPPGWSPRLLLLGALGGLQGFVGWWMVTSGLEGSMLSVASYRLAIHLGLAFVILGFLTWYILMLSREERDLIQARRSRERKLFGMGTGLMHLAFVQILLGALVAGIDAGRNYIDWPLMAGGFFPPDPFQIEPLWRNFFEDAGLVQFMHRMAGYLLVVCAIVVWLRARRSPNGTTRFAFNAMIAMILLQMVLGIVTVMYSAPLHFAILHQLGAILAWVLILRARFAAQYPHAQSVRG